MRLSRQALFDRHPTVKIGGFIRDLPRGSYPTDLQLQVYLPWEMDEQPARRYPVVYLCDGQWDGPLLNSVYPHLLFDRAVPEFIAVGLCHGGETGDVERVRKLDLRPPGPTEEASGVDFLARLRDQVIPRVEAEYPADPAFRCLAGTSLGALFTLGAAFRAPGLFQAAIAISPIPGAFDRWIFAEEAAFASRPSPLTDRVRGRSPRLPLRLFMAAGERDAPATLHTVREFDARLSRRRYRFLEKRLHFAVGEGHGGVKPEGLNRGLRFVFEGWAPSPDPTETSAVAGTA